MGFKTKACNHLKNLDVQNIKKDESYTCAQCVKTGDTWVHLRTCQECGVTLCCDSSPNKHASNHYADHKHHVVISAEPNEKWAWCYEDKTILKY